MRRAPFLFAFASFAGLAAPALAQSPAAPSVPATETPAQADDPNSTTVQEVVVTAAPFAVSLSSATTSVDVVSQQALQTAAPQGIGDLLSGLPGLRSSFFGPGASRPVIRGLSGARVLVLANGVGLVDASTLSPDHAVAAEPSESQRIEVLRGPSALAYGGSGIGGVVNVIDERIPTRAPAGGRSARFSSSYDSVDEGSAFAGGVQQAIGPVVVALDASTRQSRDYDVPTNPVSDRLARASGVAPLNARTVRNSAVQVQAYGGGLSWIGDWGYLGASVRRDDSTYGVPAPQIVVAPGDEGPERSQIHLQQTRYDLRGERRFGDPLLGLFDRVRASVGFADYEHAEIDADTGEVGTIFQSSGGEGRLELVEREANGLQGAVGLQGLSRRLEAIGDEAFIPPTEVRELGLFTLQRLDRDTWGLEGGLRFDRASREAALRGRPTSPVAAAFGIDWATAPATRDYTNVSGSLAGFLRPTPQLFLALSLSSTARSPTESELYADGPHGGTRSYELGDPTLEPERANTAEVTIRYTVEHGRVEVHGYVARYSGYIEEADTGRVEADLPVFRFTQTDGGFYGLEAEATYDVWTSGDRTIALQGTADYVRGDLDTGIPARIPPYSVTGRLTYSDPRLEGRLGLRRVGRQTRVAAFELPTDGYTMLNAFVSVRPFADRDIRLFLDGRNLTDAEAREHASFLKDIAPLPGRSLRAGVALSF